MVAPKLPIGNLCGGKKTSSSMVAPKLLGSRYVMGLVGGGRFWVGRRPPGEHKLLVGNLWREMGPMLLVRCSDQHLCREVGFNIMFDCFVPGKVLLSGEAVFWGS